MSDDGNAEWFDSDKAAAATGKMWRELGQQLAAEIPTIVAERWMAIGRPAAVSL